MKQFELKFYREWYDALAELSHDDRAAAALALLEYVYDDKIPDDQFIRIVTTLMRNRIDREKNRHNSRQQQSASSQQNRQESELSEIAESENPHVVKLNPEHNSTKCKEGSVVEPLGETAPSATPNPDNENNNDNNENPENNDIDAFLLTHYSPQSESFNTLCSKRNLNPDTVTDYAREFLSDWIRQNPGQPLPIPVRIPGTQLTPIDCYAINKARV